MRTWFTSDYHFHDELIANLRLMTVEQMQEKIIKRHNERIKKGDQVVFLGDYQVIRKKKHLVEETLSQMNGSFTFVMGNHDWNNGDRMGCLSSLVLEIGGTRVFCTHDPVDFNQRYPINLVGHVHNHWKIKTLLNKTKVVNVGVDVWGFYPVDIQDILKLISKDEEKYRKEKEKNDETPRGKEKTAEEKIMEVVK